MFDWFLHAPLISGSDWYPRWPVKGYDKMIVCFAAAHASIFNTPHKALFWLNQRVKLFYVIRKFLPANIVGNFLFDYSSFTNFNVRNS